MSLINIAGSRPVNDPSYRYKMPKIIGKVEGKGNGIKTVLHNVKDVALALSRDPAEITKFFGTEFGAQTTYEEGTDRAIVNGKHEDDDLQIRLRTYIEKFVLCQNCRYPESPKYKIKEGVIYHKCAACGHKTMVWYDTYAPHTHTFFFIVFYFLLFFIIFFIKQVISFV